MIHYMPLLFSETKIQELSSASNISVWENTLLREDPPVDTIKLFNSSSGNMFPHCNSSQRTGLKKPQIKLAGGSGY